MSELQPPTRWSADPAEAPASFADAARGYRMDGPGPEARARMFEKVQRAELSNPLTRSWHVPWGAVSALLIAGAGALLAVRTLPPPAAGPAEVRPEKHPAAMSAGTTISADEAALESRALIGGDNRAIVSERPPAALADSQEPPPAKPAARGRSARKHTPAAASSSASVSPAPSDEVTLLVRARRLLQSQPARALELAQAHSARYPRGMFAEERELLAIEALYQLGKRQLADQRGTRFLAAFPHSAHGSRIEALRSAQ